MKKKIFIIILCVVALSCLLYGIRFVPAVLEIVMRSTALMLLFPDRPITFYGIVTDYENQPVPHAKVDVHLQKLSGMKQYYATTDENGRFTISNQSGSNVYIAKVKCKGYEYYYEQNKEHSFDINGNYVADPNKPHRFIMRKKEPPTLVLKGHIIVYLANEYPYQEIDLVEMEAARPHYLKRYCNSASHIDLKAKVLCEEDKTACTFTLEEQDEGSGIIGLDELLYVPPATGYVKTFSITVPAATEVVPKYLYVKGRGGGIYSRLDAQFGVYKEGGRNIEITTWTNPNGERNVDYDEELAKQYLWRKIEARKFVGPNGY